MSFPVTSKFKQPQPPHILSQYQQLTRRFFISILRDNLALLGIFLQSILLAFCTGLIFFQLGTDLNDIRMRISLMYISNTIIPYVSLVLQIYMQSLELVLYDNEQEERLYQGWVYGLARLSIFLPIASIVGIISMTIIGFMARIKGTPGYDTLMDVNNPLFAVSTINGQRTDFLLWLVFSAISPNIFIMALSMLVTAISRSFSTASLIANSLYTILSFSCGFFIKDNAIPVWIRWTRYVSYIYHSFHALLTIQFNGQNFPCPSFDPNDMASAQSPICLQYSGEFIMLQYGVLNPRNQWILYHFLIILGSSCALAILAMFILTFFRPNNMSMSISKKDTRSKLEQITGVENDKQCFGIDDENIKKVISYLDNFHQNKRNYEFFSQQLFFILQRQYLVMFYQNTLLTLAKQFKPSFFIHNYPNLEIVSIQTVVPNFELLLGTGNGDKNCPKLQFDLDLFDSGVLCRFKKPYHLQSLNFASLQESGTSVGNVSQNNQISKPNISTLSRSLSTDPSVPLSPRSHSKSLSNIFSDKANNNNNNNKNHKKSFHTTNSEQNNQQNNQQTLQTTSNTPPLIPLSQHLRKKAPFEHRICPELASMHQNVLKDMIFEELLDYTIDLVALSPSDTTPTLINTPESLQPLPRAKSNFSQSILPDLSLKNDHKNTKNAPFSSNLTRSASQLSTNSTHSLQSTMSTLSSNSLQGPGAVRVKPARLSRRGADGIMLDDQYGFKQDEIYEKLKAEAEAAQARLAVPKKWTIVSEEDLQNGKNDEKNDEKSDEKSKVGNNNVVVGTPARQSRRARGERTHTRVKKSNQMVIARLGVAYDWEQNRDIFLNTNSESWKFWKTDLEKNDKNGQNNNNNNQIIEGKIMNNNYNMIIPRRSIDIVIQSFSLIVPTPKQTLLSRFFSFFSKKPNNDSKNNSTNNSQASSNQSSQPQSSTLFTQHALDNEALFDSILTCFPTQSFPLPKNVQIDEKTHQTGQDPSNSPGLNSEEVINHYKHIPPPHLSIISQCLPPLPDFMVSTEYTIGQKIDTGNKINGSVQDGSIQDLGGTMPLKSDDFSPSQLFSALSNVKKRTLPVGLTVGVNTDYKNSAETIQNDQNGTDDINPNEFDEIIKFEKSHSEQQISLIKSLSATMRASTSWVILGASGSGKTSLLRYLVHQLSKKSYDIIGDVFFSEQLEQILTVENYQTILEQNEQNEQNNQSNQLNDENNTIFPNPPPIMSSHPTIELPTIPSNPVPNNEHVIIAQSETNPKLQTDQKKIPKNTPPTTLIDFTKTQPISHTKANINRYVGYLSQHATLLPQLTVLETLTLVAQFSLHYLPKASIKARVLQIIRQLSLVDCQNSIVGGGGPDGNENTAKSISGGQKRLLCIGMVLLLNPSILFLDEPTSGLDAFSSSVCCNLLVDLAKNDKKLILATLHQPRNDVFSKFDNVIVLAKSNVIYAGSIRNLVPYFHSIPFIPRIDHNRVNNNNNNNNANNTPPLSNSELPTELTQSPADWVLDLVAIDFSLHIKHTLATIKRILVLAKIFWTRRAYISYQTRVLVKTINLHKLNYLTSMGQDGLDIIDGFTKRGVDIPKLPDELNNPVGVEKSKKTLLRFSRWVSTNRNIESHEIGIKTYKQQINNDYHNQIDYYGGTDDYYFDESRTNFPHESHTGIFPPTPLDQYHQKLSNLTNIESLSIQTKPNFEHNGQHQTTISAEAVHDEDATLITINHIDNLAKQEIFDQAVNLASPLELASPIDQKNNPKNNNNNSNFLPPPNLTPLNSPPRYDPDDLIELILCRYCGILFSLTTLNLPCIDTLNKYYLNTTSPFSLVANFVQSDPGKFDNMVNNRAEQFGNPNFNPDQYNQFNINIIGAISPSKSPLDPTPISRTDSAVSYTSSPATSWDCGLTVCSERDQNHFADLHNRNNPSHKFETPKMDLNFDLAQDITSNVQSSTNHSTFYNLREMTYKIIAQFKHQQYSMAGKGQLEISKTLSTNNLNNFYSDNLINLYNNQQTSQNSKHTPFKYPDFTTLLSPSPDTITPSIQFLSLLKSIPVNPLFMFSMTKSPLNNFFSQNLASLISQINFTQVILQSNYLLSTSPHHGYYITNRLTPASPLGGAGFNTGINHYGGQIDENTNLDSKRDDKNDTRNTPKVIHQFIKLTVTKSTFDSSKRTLEATLDHQYMSMVNEIDKNSASDKNSCDRLIEISSQLGIDLIHTAPFYYHKQVVQGFISDVEKPRELQVLRVLEEVRKNQEKIQKNDNLKVPFELGQYQNIASGIVIQDESGGDIDNSNKKTNNAPNPPPLSPIEPQLPISRYIEPSSTPLTSSESTKSGKIIKKLQTGNVSILEQFETLKNITNIQNPAQSSTSPIIDPRPNPSQHPSFLTSYTILLMRQIKHGLRQPEIFFTRFSQLVAFSIIVSIFFSQLPYNLIGLSSRMGSYSLLLSATSVGLLNSIATFPQERNMYYSEAHLNMSLYQPFAFMLSYTTIELSWIVISSLISTLILAIVVDYSALYSFWRFLTMTYVIASMCMFGETLAMLFCVIFFHVGFTISIVTTIISLFDMCAGIITIESNLLTFPIRILNKLSPHWYAVRVLALSDLYNRTVDCDNNDPLNPCGVYTNATEFLATFDMAQWWEYFWVLIIVMFLLNLFYRLVTFGILSVHIPVMQTGAGGGNNDDGDGVDVDLIALLKKQHQKFQQQLELQKLPPSETK
jgi:ABC-type multidrug transport system ATPase subunit/ABC-type multidrug transport system permease subunit